jgi:hypothetical protein
MSSSRGLSNDTLPPGRDHPAPVRRRVPPTPEPSQEQMLSPTERARFESLFGADFSTVRIHTGKEAGASALAIGARAYTAGRDIVFAPGQFEPHTINGRELLAHELFHVKQDGRQAIPHHAPLRVDAPDSQEERQAEQVARMAVSSPAKTAAPPLATRSPARSGRGETVVHRSLFGAGLGGLLGGAIGAVGLGLLGSLLGPAGAIAGAVIGGIGGLVAGAVIGDLASRRSRGLTGPEKTYLHDIFHDAVDYDKVTITRGSALSAGAARTTGNTINLQEEHFEKDTMELSEAGLLVLAHEMGHVWQYQNGGLSYIPSSLIPQIVAGLTGKSRNVAYDWRDAVRNHIDWADWNAEQQAECISDYNEAFRRIEAGTASLKDYETVTLAQPFIGFVRERIGAVGSSRRKRDTTATPAGATP